MFVILITSENAVPYLHDSSFDLARDAMNAARELSRDYNQSAVRLFKVGEKCALAIFRNGRNVTYA